MTCWACERPTPPGRWLLPYVRSVPTQEGALRNPRRRRHARGASSSAPRRRRSPGSLDGGSPRSDCPAVAARRQSPGTSSARAVARPVGHRAWAPVPNAGDSELDARRRRGSGRHRRRAAFVAAYVVQRDDHGGRDAVLPIVGTSSPLPSVPCGGFGGGRTVRTADLLGLGAEQGSGRLALGDPRRVDRPDLGGSAGDRFGSHEAGHAELGRTPRSSSPFVS